MKNRLADTIKMLLVKTDLNYSEIASSLCCSVGYVHEVAKENNLTRKSKKTQILELLKSDLKMSYEKISEQTGYSAKNISAIAVENGLARHTHKYNERYMLVLDYLENQSYKSLAEVARNLNLPYSYVRNIAKENQFNK